MLELLARIASGGAAAWVLADRMGSVRVVVDDTGAALDAITYDGYGNVVSETSPANGGQYKYAGYRYDPELGWYRPDPTRRRYYIPATGNWNGRDPVWLVVGEANLYVYVRNGPTNGTDPTGLKLIIADKPAGARKEIFDLLIKLFPDGQLKIDASGVVTIGNANIGTNLADCKTPAAGEAIYYIINSSKVVTIVPDVADPSVPGWRLNPTTLFVGTEQKPTEFVGPAFLNTPGEGADATCHVPASGSQFEFGHYDPKGAMVGDEILIVLAHELCGHAWYGIRGLENPHQFPHGNRPGHDQAIKIENLIRQEQGIKDMRGLFQDKPHCGESLWRRKGSATWLERPPTEGDIKKE